DRHRLDDPADVLPPQNLRLYGGRALAGFDGLHRLWAVGASYVRDRLAQTGTELLHRREHDDRDTHRDTGLLLDRDALGRAAALEDAVAVRAGLFLYFCDGRLDGRDAGLGLVQLAGARELLLRRAHPLRAHRRRGPT